MIQKKKKFKKLISHVNQKNNWDDINPIQNTYS